MSVEVDIITSPEITVNLVASEVVSVDISKGVTVSNNGSKVGTTRWIDFIPGDNVTLTVLDTGSKITVTINSTATSVSTLQNVYNNSLDPEILTDSTRNGLTIRRGSGADTDDLIEFQNGAGTRTGGITGEGNVEVLDEAYGVAWSGSLEVPTKNAIYGIPEEIQLACSDETTALTTGLAKVTFRMPYAMTLTAVRCSVTTAPTGSALTVDINESGSTILSTKLTIDATEKTSTTAATPVVISDSALANDAEITIDIDTVGSSVAGAGLKVTLLGTKA